MERRDLPHSRVFDDQEWANGYYKRHKRWARNTGRKMVKWLEGRGFKHSKVLDAGCGFGTVAVEIARAFPGSKVIGIDLSEPLLDIARAQAIEDGVSKNVDFERCDVQDMPFDDGSFDVVLSVYVLHLVEDPARMLNEFGRVLAPDGMLKVVDLKRSWLGHFDRIMASSYDLKEVRGIVEGTRLRGSAIKDGPFQLEIEV